MKKCPKCQKTYNDDQNFCSNDAVQLVSVGEADTPTVFVPNNPPPMVNPQQMQNWQQPSVNQPPPGFNTPPPPSGFNPPPFTPSAQNQPAVAGGNKLAWVGFGLLIGAFVLTILGWVFRSFHEIGFCSYNVNDCISVRWLGYITILVTGAAFLCGVIALILRFANPQNFGRKILSICVGLMAGLLFFFQLLLIGFGYSNAKSASSYYSTNNNNSSNSTSNYSNLNKSPSPTPVSLDKAILGKWREDGSVDTIAFFADNSMLIVTAGKTSNATYQITGTSKMAFLKSGVRFKESTINVTGSKMTIDSTSFTKVN